MAKDQPKPTWNLQDHLEKMDEKIDRLDEAIRGNGKEGLTTRTSKAEQAIKLLLWVTAIQALAVVGLVMDLAHDILTK